VGIYDEKWLIFFDEWCIDYVCDWFEVVVGCEGWLYGMVLEVGVGIGFFFV